MKTKISACAACPLAPGFPQSLKLETLLKAQLCVNGGIPFWCHQSVEDWAAPPVNLRPWELRICQLWKQEVKVLADVGYFSRGREEKRRLNREAITELAEFVAGARGSERSQQLLWMLMHSARQARREVLRGIETLRKQHRN
jgi:hypothetical protein